MNNDEELKTILVTGCLTILYAIALLFYVLLKS